MQQRNTRLHLALAQPSVSDARNQNPIRYHLANHQANHQIALIYFGKFFSRGSQEIIAISEFLTKKSKKTKSGDTQNLCGKIFQIFDKNSKKIGGQLKNSRNFIFLTKIGRKKIWGYPKFLWSFRNQFKYKGIPFILYSLIEKYRNHFKKKMGRNMIFKYDLSEY